MRHVFGPVLSRRLGRSLGVDTIPLKTCNWNCVYCQLGRTRFYTYERRAYFPLEDILAEVEQALFRLSPGDVDWVTIVGSGEPLLDQQVGRLVHEIKQITAIPVAVITNGALLQQASVRAELGEADAVLPSVDAGTPRLYRRINRPRHGLDHAAFIEGLVAFRNAYAGRLWVEVMLLDGLNDGDEALSDLTRALKRIAPDAIHVNSPVRPPAEAWVRPASPARMAAALSILGASASRVSATDAVLRPDVALDLREFILGVIGRHPLCDEDLAQLLPDYTKQEIGQTVEALAATGEAQEVWGYGRRFWAAGVARYGKPSRPCP
jgi:wyosine [tRNA(Phe)-imidazoG37] synthetase (radical SAM superfamily)